MEDFAESIVDAVLDGKQGIYEYDAERQIVTVEFQGIRHQINLTNLYKEYCSLDKKERADWLAHYANSVAQEFEVPKDFDAVKVNLRPSLRTRATLDLFRLEQELDGGTATRFAAIPVSELLEAALVIDLPTRMQLVNVEALNAWGISLDEAMLIAKRNLEACHSSLDEYAADRSAVFSMQDGYDASRLLLTDLIRQCQVRGQPVAMPISRDFLLVGDRDDEAILTCMLNAADAFATAESGRPICAVPHVLNADDSWQVWRVPAGHPLEDRIDNLQVDHFGTLYAEQQPLLQEWAMEHDSIAYVAEFMARRRGEHTTTFAAWVDGILTWLPKVDEIGLAADADAEHEMFSWKLVQDALGPRMKTLDVFPPRWEVEHFPTTEECERMRNG